MAKLNVPTVRDLYDSFIADYEARTGQKTPLLKSAFVRILAWPFAALTVLCYRYGQWVYFQMFLETCSFEALKLYGYRVGVDYKDGSACVATITLTGIDASVTTISAGAVFVSGAGASYTTASSTTVSSGSADCVATSNISGEAYNLSVGDELTLSSSLSGVPDTGIVTSVSIEGEDPEATGDYRTRVQARYRLQPQGGAPADYYVWATEVDGITDALPYVVRPGVTTVYPIGVGEGTGREPTYVKLTEVETYLRQSPDSDVWDRHPVQAELSVTAPSFVEYDVTITGLSSTANTSDNRANIKSALITYFDDKRPQIPALAYTSAGATVTVAEAASEAIAVLNASFDSGTFDSLAISVDGVDLTDDKDVLGVGELAALGTLTINGSAVIG